MPKAGRRYGPDEQWPALGGQVTSLVLLSQGNTVQAVVLSYGRLGRGQNRSRRAVQGTVGVKFDLACVIIVVVDAGGVGGHVKIGKTVVLIYG